MPAMQMAATKPEVSFIVISREPGWVLMEIAVDPV